jgi:ribosomal protein L11 methyltransferase
MTTYLELIINIESSKVEDLTNTFIQYEDVLAVSTTDQYEGTDKEEPIFIEANFDVKDLWQYSKVTVLLGSDVDLETLINMTQEQLGYKFDYKTSVLEDQDWVKLTQSQFEPIKITTNFYIVPSWHVAPVGVTSIILDPGLAFGTGSHPTTFMCLEWIANNIN